MNQTPMPVEIVDEKGRRVVIERQYELSDRQWASQALGASLTFHNRDLRLSKDDDADFMGEMLDDARRIFEWLTGFSDEAPDA